MAAAADTAAGSGSDEELSVTSQSRVSPGDAAALAAVDGAGDGAGDAGADRVLEPEDRLYVEELVRAGHQEVYWAGWVTLYTKSNAVAKKERLLVVSSFRLFAVKHGKLGARNVRQSYPVLDLESIRASPADPRRVDMVFAGHEIAVQSREVVQIAQAVLFARASITFGVPEDKSPAVELPRRFFDGYDPPRPDTQDGLLATYLAACDFLQSPVRLPVLDYFMAAFETGDHQLDVREALALGKPATLADVQAVAHALGHTSWFSEVVSRDYPLRDGGVSALAACVAPHVTRLELAGAGAGRAGITTLAQRLVSSSMGGLRALDLSGNPLGDAGERALVDALLEASPGRSLEELNLAGCGLTQKGVRDVAERLLSGSDAWRGGLRALDLSDNAAGKLGSLALCDWLKTAGGLRRLDLMRCSGLAVDALLTALGANEALSLRSLEGLNLSGNKFGKTAGALLARVLRESSSVSHVYLVDCSLGRDALIEAVRAALDNKGGVRYWLELSGNDGGPKGARALAELLHRRRADGAANLHTLVLNACAFGAEGVTALADALSGSNLHTLSLDNNIKTGMFGDQEEAALWAGESLARMVLSSPALRELSLAGDDSHYLRSAAYPVLRAAGQEGSALEYIDVSRNRLGDEGVGILAEALGSPACRLTSFTAERNRIGLEGLRRLHRAVLLNETLVDWAVPRTDVQNILRGAGSKVVKELRAMMYDFDMTMDRNTRAKHVAAAGGGADDSPAKSAGAADAGVSPSPSESPRRHHRRASQMLVELEQEQAEADGGGSGAAADGAADAGGE